MVTCILGLPISTKIFNFNKFDNSRDLNAFLSNLDTLLASVLIHLFFDKCHNHIIIGDLRIINDSSLKNIFLYWYKIQEE